MPSLDGPPPLPPNLAPPQQSTMSGLAGDSQQVPPNAAMAQKVAELTMQAQGALEQVAQFVPEVSALVNQLKTVVGSALKNGIAPPAAPSPTPGGIVAGPQQPAAA